MFIILNYAFNSYNILDNFRYNSRIKKAIHNTYVKRPLKRQMRATVRFWIESLRYDSIPYIYENITMNITKNLYRTYLIILYESTAIAGAFQGFRKYFKFNFFFKLSTAQIIKIDNKYIFRKNLETFLRNYKLNAYIENKFFKKYRILRPYEYFANLTGHQLEQHIRTLEERNFYRDKRSKFKTTRRRHLAQKITKKPRIKLNTNKNFLIKKNAILYRGFFKIFPNLLMVNNSDKISIVFLRGFAKFRPIFQTLTLPKFIFPEKIFYNSTGYTFHIRKISKHSLILSMCMNISLLLYLFDIYNCVLIKRVLKRMVPIYRIISIYKNASRGVIFKIKVVLNIIKKFYFNMLTLLNKSKIILLMLTFKKYKLINNIFKNLTTIQRLFLHISFSSLIFLIFIYNTIYYNFGLNFWFFCFIFSIPVIFVSIFFKELYSFVYIYQILLLIGFFFYNHFRAITVLPMKRRVVHSLNRYLAEVEFTPVKEFNENRRLYHFIRENNEIIQATRDNADEMQLYRFIPDRKIVNMGYVVRRVKKRSSSEHGKKFIEESEFFFNNRFEGLSKRKLRRPRKLTHPGLNIEFNFKLSMLCLLLLFIMFLIILQYNHYSPVFLAGIKDSNLKNLLYNTRIRKTFLKNFLFSLEKKIDINYLNGINKWYLFFHAKSAFEAFSLNHILYFYNSNSARELNAQIAPPAVVKKKGNKIIKYLLKRQNLYFKQQELRALTLKRKLRYKKKIKLPLLPDPAFLGEVSSYLQSWSDTRTLVIEYQEALEETDLGYLIYFSGELEKRFFLVDELKDYDFYHRINTNIGFLKYLKETHILLSMQNIIQYKKIKKEIFNLNKKKKYYTSILNILVNTERYLREITVIPYNEIADIFKNITFDVGFEKEVPFRKFYVGNKQINIMDFKNFDNDTNLREITNRLVFQYFVYQQNLKNLYGATFEDYLNYFKYDKIFSLKKIHIDLCFRYFKYNKKSKFFIKQNIDYKTGLRMLENETEN